MAAVAPFIPLIIAAGSAATGGKGAREGAPISGFGGFGGSFFDVLQNALGVQGDFLGSDALDQLSNVGAGLEAGNLRNQIGLGAAGTAGLDAGGGGIFETGINALSQGLESGFGGVPTELLGDLEALLRPTAERSKDTLQADVFERSAASGQTRSSGTVENLQRGFTDIENQLGTNVAGLVGQLTPALAQAQLGGIGQALNIPAMISGLLQAPINEALGGTQFALGLPGQAAGQIGGLGGIPIDAGSEGKGGGGPKGGGGKG